MKNILMIVIPWLLFAGLGFVCFKLFSSLKKEKIKTAISDKKLEKVKENIERLTNYNSDDRLIKESAEQNIKEFKESKTNENVKIKLDKLYTDFNNIYYSD